MIHQKEVLEWLKDFTYDQIKQMITIKNMNSIDLIKSILNHKKQYKPIDYIAHGYCKNQIQNDTSTIYVRDKFRYKNHNKESKKKMDQIFFQNITVCRNHPYAFSVRKNFIKTGKLSQCMLLLSEDQIFNCQNADYRDSVWFNQKAINSFSQWIIRLFQLQIFQAYYSHYQALKTNRFHYLNQIVTKNQLIQSIKTIIYSNNIDKLQINSKQLVQARQGHALCIKPQQRQYLLARCIDKLQINTQVSFKDVAQIILQYQWLNDDPKSQINLIFQEIAMIYNDLYQNYKIDVQIEEIQLLNTNKKRKKKTKKNNHQQIIHKNVQQSNISLIKKEDDHKKQQESHRNTLEERLNKKQPLPSSSLISTDIITKEIGKQHHNSVKLQIKPQAINKSNIVNQQKDNQQFIQTEQSQRLHKEIIQKQYRNNLQDRSIYKLNGKMNKEKGTKQKGLAVEIKQLKISQIDERLTKEKIMKKTISKENKMKQQMKKNKKIINQRLNQYIFVYYQQLTEQSSQQQKSRLICLQIIQNAIQELQIPSLWKLELYGSVSINFALKQSDLDLVLHIQKEGCCNLSDIFDIFKAKQWVRSCSIIKQARVPIVQFQIVLADVKHAKIKDYRKISKHLIHVDISIFSGKDNHQGMNNTIFLKQIFDENESLMVTCLIFKQLLRIYKLNKPYQGGIGSYSLVILTYNILKMKNVVIDSDYFKHILTVINFLTKQFQPYITLITPFKNSKLVPNPELILNIQDPHEHILVNTNARLISQILLIWQRFGDTLISIEQEMLKMCSQQRKKMKRVFFEKWNGMFENEQQEMPQTN